MQFKKGDLVLYKYANHELRGMIGIVLRDSEFFRTEIYFPNIVRYKTRYILNQSLEHASN